MIITVSKTLAGIFVCMTLVACRSHYVDVEIASATGAPLEGIEVEAGMMCMLNCHLSRGTQTTDQSGVAAIKIRRKPQTHRPYDVRFATQETFYYRGKFEYPVTAGREWQQITLIPMRFSDESDDGSLTFYRSTAEIETGPEPTVWVRFREASDPYEPREISAELYGAVPFTVSAGAGNEK